MNIWGRLLKWSGWKVSVTASGVTARFTYFDFLNRSTIFSVRLEPFFLAGTGMPPNALNIYLRGKKNQNSFIRKLAFLPNDRYVARPRIKSQFDVWGATQITHLSRRGAVTDTFHPLHFNSLPHMFINVKLGRLSFYF